MRSAPLVSQNLLDYLDEQYPDRAPDVAVPLDEVRALSGSVRVVRHLKKVFQEQMRNRGAGPQKE